MENIPIFVFHIGNPPYLKTMIKCAETNNVVHLIGDKSNREVCSIWAEAEDYIPKLYYEFEKVFEQMSDYSLEFDLNCFKRFFIMYEYMKRNNIPKMMFADSDLMIFFNISEFYNNNPCSVSLSIPYRQDNYRWTAQAHCSLWTIESLKDFLIYTIDIYTSHKEKLKEKYQYHCEHSLKGGVCDMTLLYLWSQGRKDVFNICKVKDGAVFDHCIGQSSNYYDDEYKYNSVLRVKKVKFINGIPYSFTKDGNKVRMLALHCQGSSKTVMKDLADGKAYRMSTYINRYVDIAKRLLKRKVK